MSHDNTNLCALDNIMSEFFHSATSNHRKREIEEQLSKFGQQKGSWRECLFFFTHTGNEYVMMYSLSVIESLVNKMWIGVDATEKSEIRTALYKILLEKHKALLPYIKKKLLKCIVDIGRLDWPMFYPDFFTNITKLTGAPNDEETRTMGLNALRIISEEMALPREDLSYHRKVELRKLLLQRVPTMLDIISDTMEKEWKKHSESRFGNQSSFISPSMPAPSSDMMGLFDLASPDGLEPSLNALPPPLPQTSHYLVLEALECLCHLFSWIPLTSSISPRLLAVLFAYTRYGVHPSLLIQGKSFHSVTMPNLPLGVLAMTCINELMAKSCIPTNFEDYLMRVFRFSFHFLKQVTQNSNPKADLDLLDEDYLEKFTEFLRLFVSVHFGRIENNERFPLMDFLELLFKFTFNQPTFDGYCCCMDIWDLFLEFLANKLDGKDSTARNRLLMPYKRGLNLLAQLVLNQILFRHNHTHLASLDNDVLDDTGHTEWQQFVIENLEIIAKICDFYPAETMSILYPVLEDNANIYLEIGRHVLPVNQNLYGKANDATCACSHNPNRHFNINASGDTHDQLHCALKDLSTALQAFGRLSEYFIGEHFHNRSEAMPLIEKFLTIAVFGSRIKFYEIHSKVPPILYSDVIEVHSQALAVLQPYTHWLSQLYTESQQAGHSQAKLEEILQGYLNAIIPMLSPEAPDKLVLPASHTLLSAINTVRAAFLLQLPIINKLYSVVAAGLCSKLGMDSQKLVYRALSNLLLLPWPNTPDSEQCWEARRQNHSSFVNALLGDYLSLTGKIAVVQQNISQVKNEIIKSLNVLEDLVIAIEGEVVKSRQLCYESFRQSIELGLELFPHTVNQPDVAESLMSFFLACFKGLRSQMGPSKTLKMIDMFIKIFSPSVLQETISHENSAGVRVVEKFIQILQLIIDENAPAFKNLTPDIIQLAVQQIYPIIAQRPSPDVKESLFELLYHILSNKTRYFFPAPVLASYLTGDQVGVLSHKNEFLAIMKAFGQSFLQPDITVFRNNLEALELLNQKQKLYEKVYKLLPDDNILFQFVTVLVQALIQKSHDLLQDEIYETTWHMASVDFQTFYDKFLPYFLGDISGITPDQKSTLYHTFKNESDQPSFTQCMKNFVNDLRYFHLCNASLPEGTVRF